MDSSNFRIRNVVITIVFIYTWFPRNCKDHSLLERVDNFALLNLDIVCCYLCLENLHELKNAGKQTPFPYSQFKVVIINLESKEERITFSERCLKNCYGSGLERLKAVKDIENANKHIPIFIRLNLLKVLQHSF